MSTATINQVLTLTYRLAEKEWKPLRKFRPHDLRQIASTLLHDAGFNSDWMRSAWRTSRKAYALPTTMQNIVINAVQYYGIGLIRLVSGLSKDDAEIFVI